MRHYLRASDLIIAPDASVASYLEQADSRSRQVLDGLYDMTPFASQAQAQTGTAEDVAMSPLRARQAFDDWMPAAAREHIRWFARVFSVNVTNSASGSADITFPPGLFTGPPVVAVTLATTTSVLWTTYYNSSLTTATGTRIGAYNTEKNNVTLTLGLSVVAFQPRY